MSADYGAYARQTAQNLVDRWFTADNDDWWTYGSGFWHSANALQALIDYAAVTGDTRFNEVIEPVHQAFLQYFYPGSPGWYDDEGWWGVALQSAYALTGVDAYRQTAEAVFEDLKNGWDEKYCGGGLWQMRKDPYYPANFKSSISNELLLDLAGRLYNQNDGRTPAAKQEYLDWAVKVWQWFDRVGFVDATGFIWGGVLPCQSPCPPVSPCVPDAGNPPCTYTQGVILGGLSQLYTATGDAAYLDAGLRFAEVVRQSMVWPDGVLKERCEHAGGTENDCNNDAKQFKGIFMRYLSIFRSALDASGSQEASTRFGQAAGRYQAFITRNADSLWHGYPDAIFGLQWNRAPGPYTPNPTAFIAGTLQTSALDCFTAAAACAS